MSGTPATRDPKLWPFGTGSWPNQPVRVSALYGLANLVRRTAKASFIDLAPILMVPSEPVTEVQQNGGQNADRCVGTGLLCSVPLDRSFVVPSSGHNDEWAAVGSDGLARYEGGQFCRCTAGGVATAGHGALYGTIEDDAGAGACGGSGMSTLGGTIRLGEFTAGVIHHCLRVNLCGKTDYDPQQLYKWPAHKADGYALNQSDPRHYAGTTLGVCPGALLAIPPNLWNPSAMLTVAGRVVGQALVDYGCRPCNDTVQSTFAFTGEWSPAGSVDVEFEQLYGFSIVAPAYVPGGHNSPWTQDMDTLRQLLHLVTNDTQSSIGGGTGAPRVALAPPFAYEGPFRRTGVASRRGAGNRRSGSDRRRVARRTGPYVNGQTFIDRRVQPASQP